MFCAGDTVVYPHHGAGTVVKKESREVLGQKRDYLVRVIQPRLSTLPGVQRALIIGDRTFAMRIWLKPERLAALGASMIERIFFPPGPIRSRILSVGIFIV